MTDNFDFLGLPSVVQELITNEIVHNSIAEDRIQLALTSKYCNELVQRARPKKIIDKFLIKYLAHFTFIANSRTYHKTKEQLMEILPNCQIKQLKLEYGCRLATPDYLAILDMLFEATRFATKLDVISVKNVHVNETVDFYVKLKHLKSVTVRNPELILPYYPSKVKLKFGSDRPGNFLEDLAKKSQCCPLSLFQLQSDVSLEQCQQFLQTAKFSTGAEIFIWSELLRPQVHLTYLSQNIFTLEMFSKNCMPIIICQKFGGENRRILKLKTASWLPFKYAFNVVSASNPDKNYFSGVFKRGQQMFILENVDRNEILIVKFMDEVIKVRASERVIEYFIPPIYSAKMLESAFPAANFTTPEERVEKINKMLGTKIQLIQVENFVQTVEFFRKI